jgi:hypothetical protein
MKELSPGLESVRFACEQDPGLHRAASVGPKTFGHRCESEAAVSSFDEDADAGERAQEPVKSSRIGTRGLSQVAAAQRALPEQVGDP